MFRNKIPPCVLGFRTTIFGPIVKSDIVKANVMKGGIKNSLFEAIDPGFLWIGE